MIYIGQLCHVDLMAFQNLRYAFIFFCTNDAVRVTGTTDADEEVYLPSAKGQYPGVPECIKFRLSVLTCCCFHGSVPSYLAQTIRPFSSHAVRHHLRSANTTTLLVPTTHCLTLGDHAFPVTAVRAWNFLPPRISDTPSQLAFHREFKTCLLYTSDAADE